MRILEALCVALTGVLVALMLVSFARRLTFPFELEWMEGATIVHIQRFATGKPVYVPPSIEFVPFAYPPLYYLLAVPFTWLLGMGFTAARLLSILAAASALAAVFAIVRRAGRVPAVVACGTFAGAYALSDGWLDLARVDALYIAWMALTWWLVARARRAADWAAAGVAAWLAFLTKQPALLSVAPLLVYLLVTDRAAARWFGGTLAALCAGSFLLLNWWSGGWYAYYVFELPRLRMAVSADAARALSFWTGDLLRPLAIAVALGAAGVVALRLWRDAAVAVGLIMTAWIARLEGGAWNNAVLPAYLAVAVLFGMSLQRAGRWMWPVTAAAVIQLAWLLYDPRPFFPSSGDRAAGERVVAALRSLPAPVLVMDHSYWATMAGLPEHAHGWATTDVVWADRRRAGPALEEEIRTAIRERRFRAIVGGPGRAWFRRDLEAHYRGVPLVPDGGYRPLSGAPRGPAIVYLPTPAN